MNTVPPILDTDTAFQKMWKTYSVWDDDNIKGFFGEYRWLSNFHPAECFYKSFVFPTSEHAYQFAKLKTKDNPSVVTVAQYWAEYVKVKAMTAREVKLWGNKILLREDWEEVKVDVMTAILFSKFSENKDLRQKLLDTGTKYLEETNHWNDRCWGVDYKTETGQNNLGDILMRIRYFWSHFYD